MAEKLSNVIGAPFPRYVLQQLYIRAARNSTGTRSIEDVLFLANKTAWVRVISSVNIDLGNNATNDELKKFYSDLGLDVGGTGYTNPNDLARNWVLEAGLSKALFSSIQLRYGIGDDGAYGIGGIEEMGYRPMPGLTSVTIESAGTLGSLRTANVNFKVWNMEQLNIIEALYFRLGYSMLIEWGHTQYFANPVDDKATQGGTFQTVAQTFGIDNPFADGINKVSIQQKIARKSKQTSGNYDGMLGIVSNFNWSFNQEGGYDCSLKIIGLGAIIDTLRVNQSYKMPPGLIKAYKIAQENILKRLQQLEAQEKERQRKEREQEIADALAKQKAAAGGPAQPPPPPVPKNFDELYDLAAKYGNLGQGISIDKFKEQTAIYPGFPRQSVIAQIPYYLFLATGTNSDERNATSFGLFNFNNGSWLQLPKAIGGNINQAAYFYINTGVLNSIARFEAENPYVDGLASTNKQRSADAIKANFPTQKKYTNDFANYLASRYEVIDSQFYSRFVVSELVYERFIRDSSTPKDFIIQITAIVREQGYTPTTEDILRVLDTWLTNEQGNLERRQVFLTDLELDDPFFNETITQDAVISGNTPSITVTGPTPNTSAAINFKIKFDNPFLIETVNVAPTELQPAPAAAPAVADTAGDSDEAVNSATTNQVDSSQGYESALHVMLSYIKTTGLSQGINARNGSRKVLPLDLVDTTKQFYNDGIFKDVFNPQPIPSDLSIFNLTFLAQKGFNSSLMVDLLKNPNLATEVPFVDFKKLCTGYLVLYEQSGNPQEELDYMVYIQFGYLLAFLNNMCLIYDSTQNISKATSPTGITKTPYVYIDFNPETNLCLTTPQHLSVDPTVCLIPLQASQDQYKFVFPVDIVNSVTDLFNPEKQNILSAAIPKFQTNNPYQGSTMNILLNVDYLLKTANRFVSNDPDNSLNLKDFLEQIVVDVNKSLGNINMFRVAYKDESNTVQIKDDQFVPKRQDEPSIVEFFSADGPLFGQLPIFGQQSLARSFQFKTNISTKLGSMIAISAQAATGSRNATDHSSLSYLNQNYRDRFKPYVLDSSAPPAAGSTNQTTQAAQRGQKKEENNDLKIANTFNLLVREIYSSFNLDNTKIDSAKNYYVERMSKVKSDSKVTTSAPFIPADLEITMDGIAGITMGNAFTIPEDRLPLSLRGNSDTRPKVGFIVTGLSHTIQDNQWLTNIKGQMIRMRDNVSYPVQAQIAAIQSSIAAGSTTLSQGCTTTYPDLPILNSVSITEANKLETAKYLKDNYPNVAIPTLAIIIAESRRKGNSFLSAGNHNYAGVQTDGKKWEFSNFNGQYCRVDSGKNLRMFASFASFQDFITFMANRVEKKGFSSTMTADNFADLYINSWWFPPDRAQLTKGTPTYNAKRSHFYDAERTINQV